jgi:predicted GNAT superfamily acetyltransferase
MRAYEPTDAEAVLAINAECVPEVGTLDATTLEYFAEHSGFFAVKEDDHDAVIGFMIGLDETAVAYPSANYAWFTARHGSFAYVDRIALSADARGKGIGPEFYRAFEAWAFGHGKPVMVAEVNTVPDNPHSHHFHVNFGFEEAGRANPYDGDEEVAYYERWL